MSARRLFARSAATLMVIASSTLLMGSTTGHAAAVEACPGETTVQFPYPLTLNGVSGTASITYATLACADEFAGVVDQGTSVYIPPGSWTTGMPYSGSCLLANVTVPFYNRPGLLVGGSVLIGEPSASQTWGEVHVLAPLSPCSEFSAVGAGSAVGVF